jgi:light-regulated signal transduction histidine kinase (bacteriophytochrome)
LAITAEFLQVLLHDLQGPVARMRMLSELLTRRVNPADEQTRVLLDHIGATANNAGDVLACLQRYYEVAQLGYHPAHFDLGLAVSDAIGRIEQVLARSGGKVVYDGLPNVRGDRALLATLFQELIKNSIRFRNEAPLVIEISAHREEERSIVVTKDNGKGLGDIDPAAIFRPFGKTSLDAKPAIGLVICSYIAGLHGGGIAAEPTSNGAEFRVTLPR